MMVWECKIGVFEPIGLPIGADHPMRGAATRAFLGLTGRNSDFTFTGWTGRLTPYELAQAERRIPTDAERREEYARAHAVELLELVEAMAYRPDGEIQARARRLLEEAKR